MIGHSRKQKMALLKGAARCKPRLGHLKPVTSETQALTLAASRPDELKWASNDFRHEVTAKMTISNDFLLKISCFQF